MATRRNTPSLAYGMGDNLLALAPIPIVARRAPTTNDFAELGTLWVDEVAGVMYGLASITAGAANWTISPAAGATVLASLTVNPGNIVVTAGNITTSAGNLSIAGTSTLTGAVTTGGAVTVGTNLSVGGTLGVTGASTFSGLVTVNNDLAVTGNVTVTGDFDITDTASISLTSTNNAAGAITLLANGGAAETILIRSAQGTSASSLNLLSTSGGVTLTGGLATADAINLVTSAAAGGIDIDAGTAGIAVDTTGAFSIDGAAASNVTTTGAGIDLTLSSVLGSVLVESTEDAALAIRLHANGGTSETIQIHSDLGTGAASLDLLSDVGGITLTAGLATADAINLVTSAAGGGIDVDAGTAGIAIDTTGGFSIDGAAASNVTTTGAGIDLTLSSVLGSVLVSSTEDAALAIRLHANGGTSETIQLHSDQGTGVGSINLLSDVGGITLTATGLASADAINLEATAGGIDADAALQINIASSQVAADALRFVASDAAGGIDVDAGTGGIAVDTTGALSLDSAAASNFTVTGAFDLTLSSSAGSVIVQGAEAVADAVQITASNAAGGLDLNAGTGGVAVDAVGGSIALTAGTGANGSITLTSTGTGDIVLNSDDTMLLDADGVLELNSSAGAINIGNDADAQAINIGSAGVRPIQVGNASAGTTVLLLGPANVGVTLQNSIRIMTGAGSPDTVVTAPAGSLWLRTDPAGATSRIYVNTDSATAWTNVTCAA